MGLTPEQKKERAKSLERLKITTYQDTDEFENSLGYVFISYKSDNWKKVFEETVLKLQDQYSLRVYSDKQFEESNRYWLHNMEKNIKFSSAVMVFISKEYLTSYATFIELLEAIKFNKEIIPVKLEDKDYFGELKKNRKLEDQPVRMDPSEADKLRKLIQNQDNSDFAKVMTNICNDYLEDVGGEKFSVMSLVEAFEKILKFGEFQYNVVSPDSVDSLFKTILDACERNTEPELRNVIAKEDEQTEKPVAEEKQNEKPDNSAPTKQNEKPDNSVPAKQVTAVAEETEPIWPYELTGDARDRAYGIYWNELRQHINKKEIRPGMSPAKGENKFDWFSMMNKGGRISIECLMRKTQQMNQFLVTYSKKYTEEDKKLFAELEKHKTDIEQKLEVFGECQWSSKEKSGNVKVGRSIENRTIEEQLEWYYETSIAIYDAVKDYIGDYLNL